MKDIINLLKDFQEEVNWRLADFFRQKIQQSEKLSSVNARMVKESRNLIMEGGKRLRPFFVYYGYVAGGGRNKKAILDACIFIELIHTYLLIHDDIIDGDRQRRGRPSLHCRYETIFRQVSRKAKQLGVYAGIVAGDLMCAFGYEILSKSNFPDELKNKAAETLSRILADVVYGQALDIFPSGGHFLTEKDVLKIAEYKTARYTIEGPLQIGAILAGAPKRTLRVLNRYAVPLGIAFQIKDDILGIFGSAKVTGKSADSDIKEGRQTLLILKAAELADKKQKDIITRALGNVQATKKQIQEVKKIVVGTEALNYARSMAEKLTVQAKLAVKKSDLPQEIKRVLSDIADYILTREK